jgi:hypothetical protein
MDLPFSPCLGKYLEKLTGNTDVDDSLEKLDKLTQERGPDGTCGVELLKMTSMAK